MEKISIESFQKNFDNYIDRVENGESFLDVAPVLQFIIKSKARLDITYRRQLFSTMYRTQANGIIINFQYSIFNVVNQK